MGHRADDLAVLHDRRTAHALDDPAALLEQAAVCDAELDPLHVILRVGVQSGDLDVKRLDLLAFKHGIKLRLPQLHLIVRGPGEHRRFIRHLLIGAVDADGRIYIDRADQLICVDAGLFGAGLCALRAG